VLAAHCVGADQRHRAAENADGRKETADDCECSRIVGSANTEQDSPDAPDRGCDSGQRVAFLAAVDGPYNVKYSAHLVTLLVRSDFAYTRKHRQERDSRGERS
jgi:hypothetical protein